VQPVLRPSLAVLSSLVVLGLTLAVACGVPPAELATSEAPLSLARCPASVPVSLAPPADAALWRVLPAEGVQIYACTASGAGFAWVFESPDALLLDEGTDEDGDRAIVGHHFAGPTWESKDHSFVVGVRVGSAPAPVPGAIPWLSLAAGAHSPGGRFARVTFIQRMDTTGGVAPAAGCDAATVGARARVPYSANYYLYRANVREHAGVQCR
jgi:hypothetical protein